MVSTVVIPIVRRLPSSANSVDMFEAIHKEVCVASQVHDSDSRWIRLLYARFYRWSEPVFRAPILVDPLDDVRLGVIHVRIFRRGAGVPAPAIRKVCANQPGEDVCVRAGPSFVHVDIELGSRWRSSREQPRLVSELILERTEDDKANR